MSQEPSVSRAKAAPAKRSEKGYGDEDDVTRVFDILLVGLPLPILSSVSHYLYKERVFACLKDPLIDDQN